MQLASLTRDERDVPMPDRQIQLEFVQDNDALLGLREDWQLLWQATVRDFYVLSFPVVWRAWTQVFEPAGCELRVVVGRSGGRVVLIWPLYIRGKKAYGLWREARWLGRDPIDYGEVLVEPAAENEAWIEAALQYIVSNIGADFLLLESVRGDARVYPVLEREANWGEIDGTAPFLELENISEGAVLEKHMPKRFRGSMNRRARRLAEVGEVKFDFARQPDRDRLEETVQWMNDRKWEWIDERGVVHPHGLEDEHASSLVDTVQDGAASGNVLVARLTLDGKLLAASVSFLSNNRLYYDFGSFDLRWAKYSPGSLLLRETIRWAVDNGVEVFDFAPGADHYKTKWSDGEVTVSDYLVACTLRGRLYVLFRGSRRLRGWFHWVKAKIKPPRPGDHDD
jgi:CelD/BcsL family acetyltransferase involved in cellulose biosynthesis